MSVEARWYSDYVRGEPPHCARLSRRPMREQWTAAIDLALAYADGQAGYRQTWIVRTHEVYWYWHGSDSLSGWWIISWRITRRALTIYRAATHTACLEGGGSATQDDILRVLRRWQRNGQWRRHAAAIFPRHPGPGKAPRSRKRRGRKPARKPRALP